MAKLLNVKGAPFAQLSAEEERGYLKEIFYKQPCYDTLVNLAEEGASRFVLGQRGQGKSATILHLLEDMKELKLLPILIDQYDEFPERNNKNYFLYTMITRLTFELAECMMHDASLGKKLNPTHKQQLGLYLEMFYDPITAKHCVESAEAIASKRRWNKVKTYVNKHIPLLNRVFGIAVGVGLDVIKSVAGLENIDSTAYGREYFQEMQLETYRQVPREDIVGWNTSRLKDMLNNLCDMTMEMGYKSVVFLFDKIDEISGINGQIEKVTMFMTEFLSDTSLLYTNNISIVVSLWSEVKNALNKQGIRFDKFKEVDIRWRNEELVALLNKRLAYFSNNKDNPHTFESLVSNANDRTTVLELVDKSPRALLNLLGTILDAERDVEYVSTFSSNALSKGYVNYCRSFDYTSAQPTRTGKGSDVRIWIGKLLLLKLTSFSMNDYMTCFKTTAKATSNHIDTLLKYNLIKVSVMPTSDGEQMYDVADPRISYLIKRNVQSLDE